MPNINFTLPEDLDELLKEKSKVLDIAKSDLIIRIIRDYLINNLKDK